MDDTDTSAFRNVEGGELYLRRMAGSRWEVNFYERSPFVSESTPGALILWTARLASHHFDGRTFETPDEAAEAVARLVGAGGGERPEDQNR